MGNFYHSHGFWFGEGTDQSWRGLQDEAIRNRYVFCGVCGSKMRDIDRSYRVPAGFDRRTGEQAYYEVVQIYWACPNHIGCTDQAKLDPLLSGHDGVCHCGMVRHDVYPLKSRGRYGEPPSDSGKPSTRA